jgi:hypothetical protein
MIALMLYSPMNAPFQFHFHVRSNIAEHSLENLQRSAIEEHEIDALERGLTFKMGAHFVQHSPARIAPSKNRRCRSRWLEMRSI